MNTIRTIIVSSLIPVLTAMPSAFALQAPEEQGTAVIGHLTHVEGNLLRYIDDDDEWVPMVKDSPVGTEDLLFCEDDSKAEFIIPNNTWVRSGGNTRLLITALEQNTSEMEVDSGMVRLYNKSTDAVIKVTTPFGIVQTPPLTACDIRLQTDTVQVRALEGTVSFNWPHDNSNHEISAGSAALLADFENVTREEAVMDEAWDEWNREMDRRWEERLRDQGDDDNYLPETIRYESHALRDNGIWETVYYEGRNCSFWRPLHVASYWSPFTVGRWTSWYGDHCWIPYEPFGYVTHHYGNWVYIDSCNRWYWAPPDCHRRRSDVYFPAIPPAWYPGRVSWIYRGDYVGWIPLAPLEPYYCYRSWGSLSRVVGKDPRHHPKDFDIKHCRYKKHAVIVKKSNFYRVTNYSHERVGSRADAFIDNFRREAGINSRVIHDFTTTKRRFAFDNREGRKLPHPATSRTTARMKTADNLFKTGKQTAIRKTAPPVDRSKVFRQPVKALPAQTKKSSGIQTIRGNTVSIFKPIQRYKPETHIPQTAPKLRVTPERKQRIGIPGGERRQALPVINQRRPSPAPGFMFQKREAARTFPVQRHESQPRLKTEQPAASHTGNTSRSYFQPRSTGFGRR